MIERVLHAPAHDLLMSTSRSPLPSLAPLVSAPPLALALLFSGCAATAAASTEGDSFDSPPSSRAVADPDLAAALLELVERDQAARNAWIDAMQAEPPTRDEEGRFTMSAEVTAAMKAVHEIDTESTAFLQELVADVGWPTRSLVGDEAAHGAWLLVQHADATPEFQGYVLELMEPLVAAGEASPTDFAYLTDRVRLARGEPQLYGSQFGGDANGVQRPRPIEDADHVEERRAELGMGTLAEYAELMREHYGGEYSTEPLPLETLRDR